MLVAVFLGGFQGLEHCVCGFGTATCFRSRARRRNIKRYDLAAPEIVCEVSVAGASIKVRSKPIPAVDFSRFRFSGPEIFVVCWVVWLMR